MKCYYCDQGWSQMATEAIVFGVSYHILLYGLRLGLVVGFPFCMNHMVITMQMALMETTVPLTFHAHMPILAVSKTELPLIPGATSLFIMALPPKMPR